MDPRTVEIFTDGSCQGNPGPGGWCAILRFGDTEKVLSGGAGDTTNNRMELTGPLEALRALKKPSRVRVVSDSRYLVQGMKEWVHSWRANGWRRREGRQFRPVQNLEIWQALVQAAEGHEVEWVWVRGHAGHPENERADRIAKAEIEKRQDGGKRC